MQRIASIVACFCFALALWAQQPKPAMVAEDGELQERGSARILYWDTKANTAFGQFASDYGRPVWKKEYEDTATFDKLTKGKTYRLGSNWWTSLDTSERIFSEIERFLRSRPEVEMYGGGVGGFGGEVNNGFVYVTMKDQRDRPVDPKTGRRLSQQDMMNLTRQATSSIPGARITMMDFSQRGFSPGRGGGFPVEFNIRGRDWDTLGRASRVIMEKMRESGLVTDVNSDYQVGMPEVQVVPDRNKAADLGISMAEIGETINSAIGGLRVGKFKDKGRRFDIRVRLLSTQRQRPEDIQRLLVRTGSGGLVRLGDIVRINQEPTLQVITRRDRERAITLTANVAPGVSQSRSIDASMEIARANMPDGYRVVASGSARTYREAFESLIFAMILGLIVAYMVLASQFNAFTHPFTVLLALPFSVSGALVALYLAGQSMNVYSMLGIILLMGIAKKNSILLVDFTNQIRAQGVERHEAILRACPIRLRPILMTSVATIAGALPPAATPRVTGIPCGTVWLRGGSVMTGGYKTVSLAAALVTVPPEFLTTTA